MKFWIDENVPKVFSKALARAGYEILKSPSRTQDLIILQFAARANDTQALTTY
jgi:predicted nuclease of predicted toxin-antitoxin system